MIFGLESLQAFTRGCSFYEDIPDTLSQLIRTAFVPQDGRKFIVADFSAIEARVIAWIAGERWRLKVFGIYQRLQFFLCKPHIQCTHRFQRPD